MTPLIYSQKHALACRLYSAWHMAKFGCYGNLEGTLPSNIELWLSAAEVFHSLGDL